MDEAKKVMINE